MRGLAAGVCNLVLSGAALAAPTAFAVWDGSPVVTDQVEARLADDQIVLQLGAGDQFHLFDQSITATAPTTALVALSSQFLTIAVTRGQARLATGAGAKPGQVLVVGLDVPRTQRLVFDARRLDASLSPGARSIIGPDVARLVAAQRRGAFWGQFEPLNINARAPVSPANEWARQGYLAQPAVVRLRRQGAVSASAPQRAAAAAQAFVDGYSRGDAETVGALLDPYPFMAGTNPAAAMTARRAAAGRLLADAGLRASLTGSSQVTADPSGGFATIATGDHRWHLRLVARDGVLFISSLEPSS